MNENAYIYTDCLNTEEVRRDKHVRNALGPSRSSGLPAPKRVQSRRLKSSQFSWLLEMQRFYFINQKIDKFCIERTLNCNRSHMRSCKKLQLFKTIRNFHEQIMLE